MAKEGRRNSGLGGSCKTMVPHPALLSMKTAPARDRARDRSARCAHTTRERQVGACAWYMAWRIAWCGMAQAWRDMAHGAWRIAWRGMAHGMCIMYYAPRRMLSVFCASSRISRRMVTTVYLWKQGVRKNVSDQDQTFPYILHGAGSFKDRNSRSQGYIAKGHVLGVGVDSRSRLYCSISPRAAYSVWRSMASMLRMRLVDESVNVSTNAAACKHHHKPHFINHVS